MLAVSFLGAEEVKIHRVAMPGESYRGLVKQRGPLKWGTMQSLTLRAVAVLCINRVTVVLKFDCQGDTGQFTQ